MSSDSDTLATINGSIAEAFYGGVPEEIKSEVYKRLDARLENIIDRFVRKFMKSVY